ncbi:MAG: hypothetical protein H7X94_11855 [Vallitaleaceae bacterium]|nr:hypothetical protein [Vallitaleaceae bacterium]
MKRILTLFLALSFIFVFNGCTKTTDINDTPSPQSPINGDDNGDINDDAYPDNDTTTNTTGINESGTYLSSLRTLDTDLRKSITDMDANTIDVNDKDYLTKSGAAYTKRAQAYQTALNNARKLKADPNNAAYNDSIIAYYQNGYDTYNNLGTKYGTFKTMNDETTYKSGLGKDLYDVKADVRTGYENALRSLGINDNTITTP